jgi:drug/metabolite transporter (DMT)-like permease
LLIGGGLLVFAAIALVQRAPLWDRRALAPVMLLRYLAETVAAIGMVLAIANAPLSTVGAILQATPLVVTAGAVLFLGERVSWRRWSAIGVGFLGVLLIIRPGAAAFNAHVLWAVLAMAALAGRDLTTRVAPHGMASAAMATFTMAAVTPVLLLWCAVTQESVFPSTPNWPVVAVMVGIGSLGYLMITASVRAAEVSVVSPFRYTRLLFLLALGMLVFGERPDAQMLLGAAIIIASGIYMMWRDKVVGQREETAPR